jgi:DNA-binding CsgD family transcriptional regulator
MDTDGLPQASRVRSPLNGTAVARENVAARRARPMAAAPLPELLRGAEWLRLSDAMGLSSRESDLVREVFYDEHVESIAKTLGLSKHTVRTYRDRLFRKLGVTSCVQLVVAMFALYVQLNPATGDPCGEGQRRDIHERPLRGD